MQKEQKRVTKMKIDKKKIDELKQKISFLEEFL